MSESDIFKAPFSSEQVHMLEQRQAQVEMHPYTCGALYCRENLVPTRAGWVCPKCDYKQNWCHRSDVIKDYGKTKRRENREYEKL